METVQVRLGPKSYKIELETGILDQVGASVRKLTDAKLAVIVTDSNVGPLYAPRVERSLQQQGFAVKIITFKAGEPSKNLETLQTIYAALAKFGVTRSDVLLALGGGVTGDMAGLAAATFLRGLDFVQIPTSLLAMVDSSVGGKVAVDLPEGKNLVGAFYQPVAVFIDPLLLETLPPRYLCDGMAEVIKYGFIKDEPLLQTLEKVGSEGLLSQAVPIIAECCRIKARVVEADEFDTGERRILNFGHTLGHAIEKAYHYSRYSHGEAVGIGMLRITKRSELLGLTEVGTSKRLEKLLSQYGLPLTAELSPQAILSAVKLDKKKQGDRLTLVLLERSGKCFLKTVSFAEAPQYF